MSMHVADCSAAKSEESAGPGAGLAGAIASLSTLVSRWLPWGKVPRPTAAGEVGMRWCDDPSAARGY
jgi:hypothetical protein